MRHFVGLILALALAAALFFGVGWGLTHISGLAAHTSRLPSRTVLIALSSLAATGLLAGVLLAVPAVSPLATGLPGLVSIAWTALLVVSPHRAISYVPMQGYAFGTGFRYLLTSGVLALAGMAMIVPLFVPSRWVRQRVDEEDEEEDDQALPEATGLLA
jgi:hypothetical protein